MRLPSFRIVITAAGRSLRRFPLVLLFAAGAAAAAIVIAERPDDKDLWERILLAATLGLPLFTATTLFGERPGSGAPSRFAAPLAGAAFLLAFFFVSDRWPEEVLALKYAQFSLGLHLLVAWLPWSADRESPGFWPGNMALFLRFLVSALFSAVLFAGLAVALAALEHLFGVEVAEKSYFRLWVVIAFVFNTWYFLGGVPADRERLERSTDYPTGLKVFSQYILVPLVAVYLAILSAYFVRVLVTHEWPSGWIGWLVSSVSLAGILALLLVHPVKDRPENRWVGQFERAFLIGLLPAIVMLFAAIGKRIAQYGITENRYFVAAWGVWIAGITLYFLFRRRPSIRVIPATLAAIAFGTSFGPWGAYAVAHRSQENRLAELAERAGVLRDGQIGDADDSVAKEDREQMRDILRYLRRHRGEDGRAEWVVALEDAYGERGRLATEAPFTVHRPREEAPPLDVRGYETIRYFSGLDTDVGGLSLTTGDRAGEIAVIEGDETLVTFDLRRALDELEDRDPPPGTPKAPPGALDREDPPPPPMPAPFRLEATNARARALLDVEWLEGGRRGETVEVQGLRATLLLGSPGDSPRDAAPGS